jgi:integrase
MLNINPLQLADKVEAKCKLPPPHAGSDASYFADCCFGDYNCQAVLEEDQQIALFLSYISSQYRTFWYNSPLFDEDDHLTFDKTKALLEAKIERDFIREKQLTDIFSNYLPQKITRTTSELFAKWIDEQNKSRNPKTDNRIAKLRDSLTEFIFVCSDKPVNEYRVEDAEFFIDILYQLPTGRMRWHKDKDFETLVSEEHKPRSSSTVGKYYQRINQFFSWLEDKDYIKKNCFKNIELKKSSTKHFAAFTDEDLTTIKNALTRETGWKRWIPQIAMYTGARASEIGQLQFKDIGFDEHTKRYFIIITDKGIGQKLKSSSAKRRVPIHKDLEEWAKPLYQNPNQNKSIWKDLEPTDGYFSNTIGRWFRDTFIKKLGITKTDSEDQRKVFHSFRTSFNTNAVQYGINITLLHILIGHEDKELGETNTYLRRSEVKLENLLPVSDWQK